MTRQQLHINIPVYIRKHLEKEALKHGYTMSWIVRALIAEFRKKGRLPGRVKRPRKFKEKHVRFCLYLYGEKEELTLALKADGYEAGPLIRRLLEAWYAGKVTPRLFDLKSVKKIKNCSFHRIRGTASTVHIKAQYYQEHEYRPVNHENNLRIMLRGLANRLQPL